MSSGGAAGHRRPMPGDEMRWGTPRGPRSAVAESRRSAGTGIHGGASIATRSGLPAGLLGAPANQRPGGRSACACPDSPRGDLRAGVALTASIDTPQMPLRQGAHGQRGQEEPGERTLRTAEGTRWTHSPYHVRANSECAGRECICGAGGEEGSPRCEAADIGLMGLSPVARWQSVRDAFGGEGRQRSAISRGYAAGGCSNQTVT